MPAKGLFQRILLLTWLTASICTTALPGTGDEEIVTSVYDASKPYLLVMRRGPNPDDREPGIYVASERGEWELILPGQLVGGRMHRGVVAQLPITTLDQRYEMVALINRRIGLFNVNSTVADPNSTLFFGDAQAPVVDLVSGQPIAIPEIEQIDDVSIYAAEPNSSGQVILFSIRLKNPMPLGDGITFAALLRAADRHSGTMTLAHPATVLDYRFQSVGELQRLVRKDGSGTDVVSRLASRALSRPKPGDTPALVQWRQSVLSTLEGLEQGQNDARTLPYFDLEKNHELLPEVPSEKLVLAGTDVLQSYDPITGADGLKEPGVEGYIIRGRIDQKPGSSELAIYSVPSETSSSLLFINHELYYAYNGDNGLTLVRLKARNEVPVLPRKLSFSAQLVTSENGEDVIHHLLLSSETESDASTEAFVLNENKNGVIELRRRFPVFNHYVTTGDLEARVRNENDQILFDNITPAQLSVAAYQQVAKPTLPFLNITETESIDTPIQTYLEPLETIEVNPFLRYERVDPEGAKKNLSKLILLGADGDPVATNYGELLGTQGPQGKQYELASQTVSMLTSDRSFVDIRLSITALDLAHTGGNGSFTLMLAAAKPGDTTWKPFITAQAFSASFPEITGIQIIRGKKKHSNEMAILVDIKAKNSGILALRYKIAIESDQGMKVPTLVPITKPQWLHREEIPFSDIIGRIKYDQEGNAYWIQNLDVDPTAENYKLSDLFQGTEILPNTMGNRGRKFKSYADENKESEDYSLGSFHRADWSVFSIYGFENRLQGTLGKFDIKKIPIPKPDEPDRELFPGLPESLDELADQSREPGHKVFLTNGEDKNALLERVLAHMQDESRPGNKFKFESRRVEFAVYEASKASQGDYALNLERLRKAAQSDKRAVLIVPLDQLLAGDRPTATEDDGEPFTLLDPSKPAAEQEAFLPHALYLLGTEGESLDMPALAEKRKGPWKNKISYVIVGTKDEWEKLKSSLNATERQSGILDRFDVDTGYLYGTWKIWFNRQGHEDDEIKGIRNAPVSDFERQVFPNISELLEKIASPGAEARHQVLIVPPELKSNIQRLIYGTWLTGHSSWSHNNPNMDLNRFSVQYNVKGANGAATRHNLSVEGYYGNFTALRSASKTRRSVLVADAAQVLTGGRPVTSDETKVKDYQISGFSKSDPSQGSGTGEGQYPHLLYLFETEGRRIQLADFQAKPPEHKIPMLLIATPSEWRQLQEEVSALEGPFGLMDRFEKIEVDSPTAETRQNLLASAFNRPEIQSFRYGFDAKGIVANSDKLTQEEAKARVISYMVSRCELMARQSKKDLTSSFIQFLTAMTRSLIQDNVARERRVIDRSFAERVLSQVFSMPINLQVLPKSDPLVKLSQRDAVLELQRAGYEGPIDLKARVIRALLSQTQNDPVKTIPSSIMLFGDTSTGKTHLFKTLVKMLGLKMYDFSRPQENQDAQAIIINVGKLIDSKSTLQKNDEEDEAEPEGGDLLTVDQAIDHLKRFLALPNGYRGWILFDDIHQAPENVRAKILTAIRSLFEANDGMYQAASGVLIPVRNLTVFMTLNPTDDQSKIERFKKRSDAVELIMATLSGQQFQVERSFLERISLLLDLSRFPIEAKAPKLRDSVRDASRDVFNNQNRLILVSAPAMTTVAEQFKDENARAFLSRATPALIARGNDVDSQVPLSIVVPTAGLIRKTFGGGWTISGGSGTEIEPFIQSRTTAIPVSDRFEGQFAFLRVMLDAFRTAVYEGLVTSISQDPRFAENQMQQQGLLAPFLHAAVTQIISRPEIPLSVLKLDPAFFGAKTMPQIEEFQTLIARQGWAAETFFPVKFADEFTRSGILSELTDLGSNYERQRGRADVLSQTTAHLQKPLEGFLQEMMRVQSLRDLPDSKAWIQNIPSSDPTDAYKAVTQSLSDIFLQMLGQLYEKGLIETTNPGNYLPLTTYDAIRLYLIALDKAIARLPWGESARFLIKSVTHATSDMTLGQLPGIQNYIFTSKLSLVRPVTHDLLIQIAATNTAFNEWPEELRSKMAFDFSMKCPRLLDQQGVAR